MRILLLSFILVVQSGVLFGQSDPIDAEGAVRQALKNTSQGGYTSTDQKELGWLGDASAIALTKIVGGKVLDGRDIESMILVITLSYEDPRIVRAASDRQPRTTLLLLRYFELATGDARLKAKIVDTERYVADRYANFTRDAREPTSIPGPK
jgi:hypothetical protein